MNPGFGVRRLIIAVLSRSAEELGWHALRLCEGRENRPRPSMTQDVPPTQLSLRVYLDYAQRSKSAFRTSSATNS